jgi:hypothetical protein
MPPDNWNTSATPLDRRNALAFSQRIPPVQYINTFVPSLAHFSAASSAKSGTQRAWFLMSGSVAPLKCPSLNSLRFRTSSTTMSRGRFLEAEAEVAEEEEEASAFPTWLSGRSLSSPLPPTPAPPSPCCWS